ncbi:MAG: hypothetical protein AB199_04065 [Parcubacteria bacterium C7867-004]|nr:MAG: hypothetical protein AB199_04065 [Parcubacteria bacterium C7867-004]
MSRVRLLIIIGSLVVLSPFMGLPMSLLSFLLPVLGLGVIAIGISQRPPAARPTAPTYDPSETLAS